jgi:hypothetical protein
VMAFQDVADRNAERRPGELNQREHGAYMKQTRQKLQGWRNSSNELTIKGSLT